MLFTPGGFPCQEEKTMAYVRMDGITKFYPESNVLANKSVDFEVEQIEIHALVGENGAGKTTLMKILYGLELPDQGKIFIRGREAEIRNPLDANSLGIGMVHQHFRLIPQFTITENTVLGNEPRRKGIFFDRDKAEQSVRGVMEEYGFDLDPGQKVSSLTVGQMQLVEIIKILYRRADILILDEPTSVLTEQQIHKLFDTLEKLTDMGKTIIIITHKLGEVKTVSQRVTVMRKGEVVAVRDTVDVDEKELSRLMVGKSVIFQFKREPMKADKVVLELQNVTVEEKGKESPLLENVNLKVHTGEVLGVAGVGGNGLQEIEDVVTGLCTTYEGRMIHLGEDISHRSSMELRKRGMAYVPADRLCRGSCLESSVLENMIVANHHSFLTGGVLRQGETFEYAKELTERYSISGDLRVPIGTLSGGNIQKVILARELALKSDCIVFSEPTWGLDVASSEFIYEKILEIRKAGVGVLLISSNLDEILGLADTLIVLYRGRIVGQFPNNQDLSKELVGEYMMGLRDDFSQGEQHA